MIVARRAPEYRAASRASMMRTGLALTGASSDAAPLGGLTTPMLQMSR
jgi:hypothetical protein